MIAEHTSRRRFVLAACALALSAAVSGCGGNLIGPPDAGPIYAVRPAFPAAPAGAAKIGWSLAILHPDMPGGLDTNRIALVQADGSMDYYAKATYPERVTTTIQDALLDGFEASGRIDAVAREDDALHADYNLLVEVKDFEAQYAAPDGIPSVKVALVAKLVTTHARRIVASQSFTQTGTASVNSAAATVQALQQALGAVVTQVVNWTLTAPPPSPPGAALEPASPGKPAKQLLDETTRGSDRLRTKTSPN